MTEEREAERRRVLGAGIQPEAVPREQGTQKRKYGSQKARSHFLPNGRWIRWPLTAGRVSYRLLNSSRNKKLDRKLAEDSCIAVRG